MIFSFIGDIALNHNKDHSKQSKKDFILGGIAFVVAHIFYCLTYYWKIKVNNFVVWNIGAIFAIIILLLVTVIMLKVRILGGYKNNNKLFSFGIAYLWITGINYTTILSYSYSVKSIGSFAALGGLMFLASDIIIGVEKFFDYRSEFARELVWWLYPIGQILLIIMA